MARKIELTTITNEELARTQGLHVSAFTTELGIWKGESEEELLERFIRWADISKYRTAHVWKEKKRSRLIFRTGYTILDQLNSIIEELAGDGEDDAIISFHEVFGRVKFRSLEQSDEDVQRTVFHNIDTKWLPTTEDQNYWTQYLSEDNSDPSYQYFKWPLLPSVQSRIFKPRFNPNTDR